MSVSSTLSDERRRRLQETQANMGPASRPQEIIEPLHPTALRILVLARDMGATMIGEAGTAVLSLLTREMVVVTPCGPGRFRVEITDAGLAAIEGVSISNQDHSSERHALTAKPRCKPENDKNWGKSRTG